MKENLTFIHKSRIKNSTQKIHFYWTNEYESISKGWEDKKEAFDEKELMCIDCEDKIAEYAIVCSCETNWLPYCKECKVKIQKSKREIIDGCMF